MNAQRIDCSHLANCVRRVGLLVLLILFSATTSAAAQKLDRAEMKKLKQATVLLKVRLSDGRAHAKPSR